MQFCIAISTKNRQYFLQQEIYPLVEKDNLS